MKKVLALLLTVSLTLTLALSGQAAEEEKTIQASRWAVHELERAWEAGVFPAEIDPYRDDCTREMIRAEFAAITVRLYELMGGKLHLSSSFQQLHPHPFTDIDNYDYNIREAYGLGFINGVTEDTFDPNGILTREQAAAMLGRVYEKVCGSLPAAAATSFADDGKVDRYAKAAVDFLARNGVVGGIGGNEFAPKKALTVQEAVIMAYRMLTVETWDVPAVEPQPSPEPETTPDPEATQEPESTPDPEITQEPETDTEETPAPETSPDPESSPAPESTPEAGGEAAAEPTETPAVGPVG